MNLCQFLVAAIIADLTLVSTLLKQLIMELQIGLSNLLQLNHAIAPNLQSELLIQKSSKTFKTVYFCLNQKMWPRLNSSLILKNMFIKRSNKKKRKKKKSKKSKELSQNFRKRSRKIKKGRQNLSLKEKNIKQTIGLNVINAIFGEKWQNRIKFKSILDVGMQRESAM